MPTIIDSLIVQLGLDSKDVEAKAPGARKHLADLEKAALKTEVGVKGIGKASKETGGELTVLTAKLGSFLAVLGGTVAVRAFVKDTIETNTQLYFLSRNLEMSTQKLFAWGAAAQEIGGNKGTLQNFMKTIAGMPGELMIGRMPQLLPLFARLGINFRQPFDQIMVDLSKRFSGMDRKIAFSFGTASGIPEDVMNLLLQGPGAMQAAMKRTQGFAPTGREAQSAAELKRGFTDLELQLVKIGYDLLYKVTPYLERFLAMLQQLGAWAQKHEKIVAVIAGILAGLSGIAALATSIGAVALAWGALTGAMVAMAPVLAVVGLVASLGAAVLMLWQDYQTWANGGKSDFDWTWFAQSVRGTADAFNWLATSIENATNSFNKWLLAHGINPSAIGSAIGGVISGSSGYGLGQSLRGKADMFVANHSLSRSMGESALIHAIATGEGFYNRSGAENIPQKAHNPGDIEYGDFARDHGAIGYVLAKGGKKIANFPDDATGFAAMRALLGTKGYAGLSPEQTIARWQTGSAGSLLNGISGASRAAQMVSSERNTSSTSNDNSRVTHIGTINLTNPFGAAAVTPSMARGMDWTTLLTQQNAGLMP